jgi:uncharacterized protein YecE (DUF72 family)
MIRIGTAGWAIPRQSAGEFPSSGSTLARYARRFNAVEINSSFHRPHRRATYERWAASVPGNFAFAVKAPRDITHDLRLARTGAALDAFLAQATGLGDKLGALLFQFPPSLVFDVRTAGVFFRVLRKRYTGGAVCEPRHPTWFTSRAEDLLLKYRVARVAADPAKVPAAAEPGGWPGLRYVRLHGSPRIYYSNYEPERLAGYAEQLKQPKAGDVWCILDNTALGCAAANALALQALLREGRSRSLSANGRLTRGRGTPQRR